MEDSDSERIASEKEFASNLGVIEIKVWRCDETGLSNYLPLAKEIEAIELAEKSLKGRAISHGTGFSETDG